MYPNRGHERKRGLIDLIFLILIVIYKSNKMINVKQSVFNYIKVINSYKNSKISNLYY